MMKDDSTTAELENLESEQRKILEVLRGLLNADDPDSSEVLSWAELLRINDDRINEILEGSK